MNYTAALMESQMRIARANQRATLMAGIGLLPLPVLPPLFRRTARPLESDVVIRHAAPEAPAAPLRAA